LFSFSSFSLIFSFFGKYLAYAELLLLERKVLTFELLAIVLA